MAIYIDGKRVDHLVNECGDSPEIKKVAEIAAGETFENDGSVEVSGNVGEGAVVKIKNGGLTVKGDVQDNAKIKVETSGASGSGTTIVSSGGNTVISTGRGNVISTR